MTGISEAEKKTRRAMNASVIGTHAMEGLTFDAATLELMRQFEEGLLTGEQLSFAMNRYAAVLVAELQGSLVIAA